MATLLQLILRNPQAFSTQDLPCALHAIHRQALEDAGF